MAKITWKRSDYGMTRTSRDFEISPAYDTTSGRDLYYLYQNAPAPDGNPILGKFRTAQEAMKAAERAAVKR
jgi:hypothetical protein